MAGAAAPGEVVHTVPWYRRRPASVEVEESAPVGPGQATDAPCTVPGCTGADRVGCDYRDRRGTPCPTAWCPEHVVIVGEWHLCRRHASLSRALAPAEFRGELPAPDLDNRAPSLAFYLRDALDQRVRQLLDEVTRTSEGEVVGIEPLTLVVPRPGSRRWTSGWKLYDGTGPLLRIGVEVEEASDPECSVRLNGRVILRCVPPWIEARGSAAATPGGTDQREGFYAAVVDHHLRPAVLDEDRWMRRWEHPPRTTVPD